MESLSPIVLFVYNRPWHTKQTVEALQRNDFAHKSDLIIYSDAARTVNNEEAIQHVRNYSHRIKGFKSINIHFRNKNYGVADSIISGVTETIDKYGHAIILEDDIITSKYFLRYMNEALQYYKKENKIISIHGYTPPVYSKLPETFFLQGSDCWGWATWKRGWDLFEPNGEKLMVRLKEERLLKQFDREKFSFAKMLNSQIHNKIDSWAIRWHASAFLANKLTLYPGISLVNNIGNDNSGRHCGAIHDFDVQVNNQAVQIGNIEIHENVEALRAFKKFMRMYHKNRIKNKILNPFRFFKSYLPPQKQSKHSMHFK